MLSLLLIICSVLLSAVFCILVIHLITYFISQTYLRKHYPKEFYHEIKRSNRVELVLSRDKSLMLSFNGYNVSDAEELGFTKVVRICFGGYSFHYRYRTFKSPQDAIERKNFIRGDYGLYSIDGEWWSTIFWGRKTYNNPFYPNHHLGCWVYDFDKNRYIDKSQFERDQSNFPLLSVLKNTPYITKSCKEQMIDEIHWWMEKREWTLPVLHFLHLDFLYRKPLITLEFEVVGQSGGLGDKRDTWKGGVYASSIHLTDDPTFLKFHNLVMKQPHKTYQLKEFLYYRINSFMSDERKY